MDRGEDESSDTQSNDQPDAPEERCEYCGRPIDTNDWYPITKDRDSDGSLRLNSFCSEECQAAWLDERSD